MKLLNIDLSDWIFSTKKRSWRLASLKSLTQFSILSSIILYNDRDNLKENEWEVYFTDDFDHLNDLFDKSRIQLIGSQQEVQNMVDSFIIKINKLDSFA